LAWNPGAAGLKVDGTAIVAPEGPELLVYDASLPRIDVAVRAPRRPHQMSTGPHTKEEPL
jgi:hypothetical protein